MKKVIVLLSFISVCVSVCPAQSGANDIFHRKYMGLQGDVMRVTHRVYTKSGVLPAFIAIDEFDESGNLVRQQSFNREGVETGSSEIRYENGEEVEIIHTSAADGSRVVHRRVAQNGNEETWIREEEGRTPRRYVKVYDPVKRTLTHYALDEGGNRTLTTESRYDERGNEVAVSGVRILKSVFEGNKEMRRTTGEGKSRSIAVFSYDKYDEQGNWTECSATFQGVDADRGIVTRKEFEYR